MIKLLHTGKLAIAYHASIAILAASMTYGTSILSDESKANAQTDFNILSESENIKSEFQNELDKWMLRAYEGDRDAQFKVGVLFANDQFGPPDNEQATYWFKQAARQGHPLAQYNLGHQYLTGSGVKRDEKAAMQWWLKAAQQQHALAQFNVGRAYYLGIGLAKDLPQAKLWFERASQNNEPKSTELLKALGWWNPGDVAAVDQPTPKPTKTAQTAVTKSKTTNAQSNSFELQSTVEVIADTPFAGNADIADDSTATELKTSDVPEPLNGAANDTNNIADETLEASVNMVQDDDNRVAENTTPSVVDIEQKTSVAIFTNPAVRSVLVTIIDDIKQLNVLEEGSSWTTVNTDKGFPVWVNKNFIRTNGNRATITANSVNARSVPLITIGSVIGRFDKGETAQILDRRNDWYRVMSPKRFKGWVKTTDLLLADQKQTAPTQKPVFEKDASTSPGTPDDTEPATITANEPEPEPAPQTIEPLAQTAESHGDASISTLSSTLPSELDNNSWLFSQNEDHYTLQMASFNDVESIERFVETLSFKDSTELRLFTTKSNDGVEWTYVIYGSYPTESAAKAKSIKLKQRRAWVRRIGALQQNRCIAWKKQLPAPKELNKFCT